MTQRGSVDGTGVCELERRLGYLHAANAFAMFGRRKPRRVAEWRKHASKCLYFMLCGDTVKVGVSSDPPARMESLQTGAPLPLHLLASIPLAGGREAECHKRLAHLHLHGEWFRYTPEVDSLIEELSR